MAAANPIPSQSTPALPKPPKEISWKTFEPVVETAKKVAHFILFGILARFFVPPISTPLLIFSVVAILTNVAVKKIDDYNSACLKKVKSYIQELNRRYNIKLITLVTSLVLAVLSSFLGGLIATASGIFEGVQLDLEMQDQIKFIKRHSKQAPPVPSSS